MNIHAIDIVVPSYRLDEEILLNIINLEKPGGFNVFFYIVSDNPEVVVPASVMQLHNKGLIQLIINPVNMGAPATRNVGIKAGKSKWILFLDDDIKAEPDLLLVYAAAIKTHPDAIGFAGITQFPQPINAVTKALEINGTISSFTDALRKPLLTWSPTANVMLNRQKMHPGLFDAALVNAEDIEFLTRSSLLFNEKYIPVAGAVVHHPWWGNGSVQTRRMVSYGAGASQIARKQPVSNYTFRDFTNTSETLLLLTLLTPVAILTGTAALLVKFTVALLLAEFITNLIKTILVGKSWSLATAFHVMWAKNCYEFSFLRRSLKDGFINGFALRIDMGFNKPHPSSFRTNRWKIIKMAVLVVLLLVAVIAF
ncbi:glycosyltransferase family A protein [Foetidibacter luteolus]|uniref:glycosyltransferase family A protein n=1 Tax=Foetidibacter luteolus TaxID=2608880 RepID=UPI00129B929B|nr:glycosyltransferase family A protein [Foetidibacter luteolus]